MTRIVFLIFILTLAACGPSQEEIENTAIIACNIMGESRNMDASMRIREINAAREKIDAAPFLDSDEAIKESFEFGLCEELVRNDPDYQAKLVAVKEMVLKAKREESARRAEESLQQMEREAEERRVRRAKEAEERRVRLEREAEAKRQREQKRKEQEAAYKEVVEEHLKALGEVPSLLSITFDKMSRRLTVKLGCSPRLNGIDYDLKLTFVGEKQLKLTDSFYYCRGSATLIAYDVNDKFFFESASLMADLVSADLEVKRLNSRHIPIEASEIDLQSLDPDAFDLPKEGLRIEQRVILRLETGRTATP